MRDESVSHLFVVPKSEVGDPQFEALRERLQIAVALSGLSQRQLSIKARLSKSFVESILNRRSKSPEQANLRRLADAADVDVDWFLTGRGAPRDPSASAPEDRYEAMHAVRQMARLEGIDEEFVAKWEALLDYDYEPKPSQLWGLLLATYQDAVARRQPTDEPLSGIDNVRPARKKK